MPASRQRTARVDSAAVVLIGAGLFFRAALPEFPAAGVILVIAAVINAWRLARWAGGATAAEPLLLTLHVGYGWVVIGTALLGLSILDAGVPMASAIHALTAAGAIGTMILAVMPRVTLGHTGRDLTANRVTVAIFVLINAGGITRVCASWQPVDMTILLALSAGCWIRGVRPVRDRVWSDAVDAATHALRPVAMSERASPQEAHWPAALFSRSAIRRCQSTSSSRC
jgi:uncharacterized protein involved in response to NO